MVLKDAHYPVPFCLWMLVVSSGCGISNALVGLFLLALPAVVTFPCPIFVLEHSDNSVIKRKFLILESRSALYKVKQVGKF